MTSVTTTSKLPAPGSLGAWLRAIRYHSFTASIIPILVGSALAAVDGEFGDSGRSLRGGFEASAGVDLGELSGITDEHNLRVGVGGMVEEPGEVLLQSSLLHEIARAGRSDVLAIRSTQSGCEIVEEDARYELYGADPKQFPLAPTNDGEPDAVVALDDLRSGIKRTAFAAATQSCRPAITGVFLKQGNGKAVLMNLSPQWYNAYRQIGFAPSRQREVFMKHVKDAGLAPWVRLKGASAKEFGGIMQSSPTKSTMACGSMPLGSTTVRFPTPGVKTLNSLATRIS
mgnify:CR=1 FL=1